MSENDVLKQDRVIADKNILLSIIRIATKETTGVASVVSTFGQKIKHLVNSNTLDGVSVSYDNKGKLNIDVYVKLYYNYNVSEVAYKIQKNIKNVVSTMIDYEINDINIHVVDVVFEENEN